MTTEVKILRKNEVLDILGISRSNLHQRITNGIFPPPIPLGERAIGFINLEVNATLAAMIQGKTKQELVNLVKGLVAKRGQLEVIV